MKSTKHAYVKVWQNRPEDKREDTTITLYDHEDANEPNNIPAALLYLLERYTFANSSYRPRYGALIRPDTTQRHINGQAENNTEHHQRIPETYKNNPDPLFRHNYGQRSKHAGQNQPAHKHQNNHADILRTLKLKTETQPTFDLTETNQ